MLSNETVSCKYKNKVWYQIKYDMLQKFDKYEGWNWIIMYIYIELALSILY